MTAFDVYFYEAFEEEADALRRYLPDDVSAGFTWKTIQEQGDHDAPAPIVSVRTQARFPESWASRVSGILTRSTGYDHIVSFWKMCTERVPAGYLPLYCNRSVAEHVLMLWMALIRKLPAQNDQFGNFNRDGLTGWECRKRTLLVVGVGNIGYEVVQIGRALEMEVIGVDIVEKHADVDYLSIDEGIGKADIVVCSMNLTDDNVNYFNEHRLRQTKKGAFFINIARGEMSPSQDLLTLVREDHLGGVGLDVYNREDEFGVLLRSGESIHDPELKAVMELAAHPKVITTPHNAFNTEESIERKAEQSVEQIVAFMRDGRFPWPVPEA